jgi:hypothetical protein
MDNLSTGLTGAGAGAYVAYMEPGKGARPLAVSLLPEDDRQLSSLRAHLEAKTGERYSLARVVRMALDDLAEREGIE